MSTVPRGGLQIAQPANVPDALLKSYGKGFHTEDRLSWQAIIKKKAVRPNDVYSKEEYESTPYVQEMLEPEGLKYAVALPLAAPVFRDTPASFTYSDRSRGRFHRLGGQSARSRNPSVRERRTALAKRPASPQPSAGRLEANSPNFV